MRSRITPLTSFTPFTPINPLSFVFLRHLNRDEYYMNRCLELASSGRNHVAPNPMVGSVIVHEEKIIGEGYHHKLGDAHAEVNAINAVEDKSLLENSTLYVNLEPCSHYGKTPPCADLIVTNGIKRVVIATLDSNPEVAGKGVKHLEKNNIEVSVGILEEEARNLNRRFFTFHEKKRPYIILKWAQSADAYMDVDREHNDPEIHWISNAQSKRLVHQWRAEENAILVGKDTVINDDPSLTTREVVGPNPIRIVIDPNNILEEQHSKFSVFSDQAPTLVYNYDVSKTVATIDYIKLSKQRDLLDQLMKDLFDRNIQSVIIEGGRFTLDRFIEANLWDEARVIRGVPFFKGGIKAPNFNFEPNFTETIDSDLIDYYSQA